MYKWGETGEEGKLGRTLLFLENKKRERIIEIRGNGSTDAAFPRGDEGKDDHLSTRVGVSSISCDLVY